jgi:hypothetical protein
MRPHPHIRVFRIELHGPCQRLCRLVSSLKHHHRNPAIQVIGSDLWIARNRFVKQFGGGVEFAVGQLIDPFKKAVVRLISPDAQSEKRQRQHDVQS